MRRAAAKGFINATDCADYLTKKGVPFRDAYKLTGSLVAHCIANGTTLEALPRLIDGLREKGYALEPLDRSVTGISFAYADCLD